MKWLKRLLKYTGLAMLLLLLAMFVRVFTHKSTQHPQPWKGKAETIAGAAERLSTAISFQTLSSENQTDTAYFRELVKLKKHMRQSFPLCFAAAQIVELEGGALLMKFFEKECSHKKPAIFLAHLDVVKTDSADLSKWKFPPFSGKIYNDSIYGRGALDDKVVAFALLEAMEKSLSQGITFHQPIYFAFGSDEEVGGKQGAAKLAAYLKSNHITADFIADEGLGVSEGIVPGISKPAALIGLSEKGFCSIKVEVTATGGHSSMPEGETATGLLAEVLQKIDKKEIPSYFSTPMQAFLENGAPEMNFGYRFLFSNLWVTAPLVKKVMNGSPKTAASIKTIKSITMIQAGVQDNVIPNYASAVINFRVLPGMSTQECFDFVSEMVKAYPNIKLSFVGDRTEPAPISPMQAEPYLKLEKAIHQTFQETVVLPAQVLAGTDCKHYIGVSKHIYRFVPLRLNNQNTSGIHGINEHISINNYAECIQFYRNLFALL